MSDFFSGYLLPNKNFCANTWEHWLAVLFVVTVCSSITFFAVRSDQKGRDKLTRGFAWGLVINVLIWQFVKSYISFLPESDPAYVKYHWGEDLPLNPCNWLAFVALGYSYLKKPWMWFLLYFFVWVFTFNAILTPALYEGFPHYNFCKFWIAHTGLVMFVIHFLVLGAPKIETKHLFQAYGVLQVFAVSVIAINFLVGETANYFYLARKPGTASILDILGPWPWYIIQGDIVALGLFFLAWLPYRLWSRHHRGIPVPASV